MCGVGWRRNCTAGADVNISSLSNDGCFPTWYWITSREKPTGDTNATGGWAEESHEKTFATRGCPIHRGSALTASVTSGNQA